MEYYICMVTAFQFKKKNAFIILFSQSPSITYKDYYSHSEISETKIRNISNVLQISFIKWQIPYLSQHTLDPGIFSLNYTVSFALDCSTLIQYILKSH